nr:methyl-accepting chemotaxis protein [Candidatus Pantoea persica]
MDDMHNQVEGISEMATMFNATLTEEVSNYTRLFASFLPQRFSSDDSARIQVGEFSTPTLRAGLKTLNLDQVAVDDFLQRTAAVSTIFVRDGEGYYRISTSLKKEGWQPRHRHPSRPQQRGVEKRQPRQSLSQAGDAVRPSLYHPISAGQR